MARRAPLSESEPALPTIPPEYIAAAMPGAVYEVLEDDGRFYGSIPGFPGVWGVGPTQEACAVELAEVLEDWTAFRLARGLAVPVIAGLDLNSPARR